MPPHGPSFTPVPGLIALPFFAQSPPEGEEGRDGALFLTREIHTAKVSPLSCTTTTTRVGDPARLGVCLARH